VNGETFGSRAGTMMLVSIVGVGEAAGVAVGAGVGVNAGVGVSVGGGTGVSVGIGVLVSTGRGVRVGVGVGTGGAPPQAPSSAATMSSTLSPAMIKMTRVRLDMIPASTTIRSRLRF
jgi:hypothetical protein